MNFDTEPEYYEDTEYGKRLLIHKDADLSELEDNLRAARSILKCFPNTYIEINAHRIILNEKNPEYTIDRLIGDRKGIMSERGVRSSFEKGKKQGCKAIVLDLDKHLSMFRLHTIRLSKEIYFRQRDFREGLIERCYVVYRGNAACITVTHFSHADKNIVKGTIEAVLQKIAE